MLFKAALFLIISKSLKINQCEDVNATHMLRLVFQLNYKCFSYFQCLTMDCVSTIITQSNRGVVQLVEQRSPKPSVACSSRVSPVFFLRMWWNGRHAGLRNQSERVWVRLPPSAPKHSNPNLLLISKMFGFVVFVMDVKQAFVFC